ncbi:MAG: hypothetical protein H6Q51_2838 [Deltaproteobacteria bacterium]|nr:hypothetical protein [Deltaproteobacteria bacterium]
MDVARPLVEGVAEQVVNGVGDVLVARGDLAARLNPGELLQVPQVHERPAQLAVGRDDGSLEPIEFRDGLENISLGADQDPDPFPGDPFDIFQGLPVERVVDHDGQGLRRRLHREHQVGQGEGLGNVLGHHLQIQLEGIDPLEANLKLFGHRPHDGLFVEASLGALLRLQVHGGDHIHGGDLLGRPEAGSTGVPLEPPDLLQLVLLGRSRLDDEGFLLLGDDAPLCHELAQVGDIHGDASHGGPLGVSRGLRR